MTLLLKWAINAAALLAIAYILPGFTVDSGGIAILAALILGLANTFIKPLLVVLTLPVTVITLGLFLLVINAMMLLLTASLLPGFEIQSIFAAMLGSIILWAVGMSTNWITKN